MSIRKSFVLVGVALIATLAWFVSRREPQHQTRGSEASYTGEQRNNGEASEEPHQAAELTSGRTDASAHASSLAIRVVAKSGQPIGGALITWTPLFELDSVPEMNWQSIDWRAIESATLSARSDESGVAEFERAPAGSDSRGSVAWVTATGYEATCRVLTGADETPHGWAEIVLARARGMKTRVLDETGAPVAGAQVTLIGLAAPKELRLDANQRRAHRLFLRRHLTDANGETELPLLGAVRCAYAERGTLISGPWVAAEEDAPDELTLALASSFVVTGRVSIEGTASAVIEGAYVTAFAVVEGALLRHGQAKVGANGAIDPWHLPAISAAEIEFRLDGGGLEPRKQRVLAPKAGGRVEIAIQTRMGRTIQVRVLDAARLPIPRASVSASAVIDGQWVSTLARTDDHGIATVSGCFQDAITLRSEALGFVSKRDDGVRIPQAGLEPYEVVLQKAGVIEGVCRREGAPVRSFTLIHWVSDPYKCTFESYADRADGSFRIEAAPVGQIHLMATSPDLSRMEPVRVDVLADQVNRVEIEVPSGFRARGRVTDAATQAPVVGAEVVAWASQGTQLFMPSGASERTDASGAFELPGLGPGDGRFEVKADGYANSVQSFLATRDGQDLGVVSLAPRQSLTVSLTGLANADYAGFELSMVGGELVESRRFDASGVAVVPGLSPGPWTVVVRPPDGTWETSVRMNLIPGRVWNAPISLVSDRTLAVRVEYPPGVSPRDDLTLRCLFVRPDGRQADSYHLVPFASELEVRDVSGGYVNLELLDPNQSVVGSTYTRLATGVNAVTVQVGERPLSVRIVDSTRTPIENVQVAVTQPTLNPSWVVAANTDASGSAVFTNVAFDEVLVALSHPVHGTRIEIPVDVEAARGEAVEIELNARAALRIELRDGSTLLPGVSVHVSDCGGNYNAYLGTSDGNARIEAGRLAEGTYQMHVNHTGIWPAVIAVHALHEAPDEVVQLRRIGALELVVRDATGLSLVEVDVALHAVEFDTDVAEWIAAGRVSSSTRALRTDAQGFLRISGLPRGEYRWSAGRVEGSVIVPPLASVIVPVVVP